MHVLWETDRWLDKYCVSNTSNVDAELDACKADVNNIITDSENKAVAATGGGSQEQTDFEHDDLHSKPRSLLW